MHTRRDKATCCLLLAIAAMWHHRGMHVKGWPPEEVYECYYVFDLGREGRCGDVPAPTVPRGWVQTNPTWAQQAEGAWGTAGGLRRARRAEAESCTAWECSCLRPATSGSLACTATATPASSVQAQGAGEEGGGERKILEKDVENKKGEWDRRRGKQRDSASYGVYCGETNWPLQKEHPRTRQEVLSFNLNTPAENTA